MKVKKKCFLWALILVILASVTAFAKDYALRKVYWEMTRAQVKAAESDKLIAEKKNELFYATKIKKYSFKLGYAFLANKDKLWGAVLILQGKPSNEIYIDLEKILELKYGKVAFKENNNDTANVIWKTKDSQITLFYDKKGDKSNKPSLSIQYMDKKIFSDVTSEDKKASEKL